jgi:hypothetical protein
MSGDEIFPVVGLADAERGDETEAGDGDGFARPFTR